MKLKSRLVLLSVFGSLLSFSLIASGAEEGFKSLMDGKSFAGWKKAEEHTNTWTIQNGAFVAHGDRCHLFYVGDEKPFKNFDLKVDVMTKPGSNGGIYFHTRYQASDWPKGGFECQVNNTHKDPKKTASLYNLVNLYQAPAEDNKWWTQEIIVKDQLVTVLINGKKIFDYTEPPGTQPSKPFEHKLGEGTFALQGHDPNSEVHYKNIRVKRLD